jgi:hypothetical protein
MSAEIKGFAFLKVAAYVKGGLIEAVVTRVFRIETRLSLSCLRVFEAKG